MAWLMVAGEVPEYDVPHREAGKKTISSSSTRKSDGTLHILSTFLDGLITPRRRVPRNGTDNIPLSVVQRNSAKKFPHLPERRVRLVQLRML